MLPYNNAPSRLHIMYYCELSEMARFPPLFQVSGMSYIPSFLLDLWHSPTHVTH